MITISRKVYTKFLRFALEYANPYDHKNWKECIGLILGRINGDQVRITDIIPIGSGSAVFVDISDYEKVFSLISYSRIDQGEVIVGWAHTHPGLGLFLSGTDIRTQQSYQKMHSKAFALVLDPTKISNNFSGFNIFRLNDSFSQPVIEEYEFDEEFNFQNVKERLSKELYPIPTLPAVVPPIISSDTSVSWKNITIQLDGPSRILLNEPYQVKILIYLPFRQFVRLDYKIETDDLIIPISTKIMSTPRIFHETLTSGTIGIYTFHPKKRGQTFVCIKEFHLLDYTHSKQRMPNLWLKTSIG